MVSPILCVCDLCVAILSDACVALTLDNAYARCVTAPSLLALCDCISSNFYVFPSSAVLFGCLCCPFGTQTNSLLHTW